MRITLPPASTRCGSAAAQVFHVPMRFTSTTARHCSDVVVSHVPTVSTPALATAASSPPSSATPSCDRRGQAPGVAHVDHRGDGAAAVFFDQANGLVEIFARRQRVLHLGQRLTDVDQDEVSTLLGQAHRMTAAHPARGAGHQDTLAGNPTARVRGTVDLLPLIACCRNPRRPERSRRSHTLPHRRPGRRWPR